MRSEVVPEVGVLSQASGSILAFVTFVLFGVGYLIRYMIDKWAALQDQMMGAVLSKIDEALDQCRDAIRDNTKALSALEKMIDMVIRNELSDKRERKDDGDG